MLIGQTTIYRSVLSGIVDKDWSVDELDPVEGLLA